MRTLRRGCGNIVKDYSKGARLHELHVLLAETVMVRILGRVTSIVKAKCFSMC